MKLLLSTTLESQGGKNRKAAGVRSGQVGRHIKLKTLTPESGVHIQNHVSFRNKSTLVKVTERLWFRLNVNKHVESQVITDVFCIKPGRDLSLTLLSA